MLCINEEKIKLLMMITYSSLISSCSFLRSGYLSGVIAADSAAVSFESVWLARASCDNWGHSALGLRPAHRRARQLTEQQFLYAHAAVLLRRVGGLVAFFGEVADA